MDEQLDLGKGKGKREGEAGRTVISKRVPRV